MSQCKKNRRQQARILTNKIGKTGIFGSTSFLITAIARSLRYFCHCPLFTLFLSLPAFYVTFCHRPLFTLFMSLQARGVSAGKICRAGKTFLAAWQAQDTIMIIGQCDRIMSDIRIQDFPLCQAHLREDPSSPAFSFCLDSQVMFKELSLPGCTIHLVDIKNFILLLCGTNSCDSAKSSCF